MDMIRDWASRHLPTAWQQWLQFHMEPGEEGFRIVGKEDSVRFFGESQVSLACALMHYLKYECHIHYSWCGEQLDFPARPPIPSQAVVRTLPLKRRPYLNFCTFGYSMAWWDRERWIKEIDFMALNGINMPLAITGVEAVWRNTFRRLGVSDEGTRAFLSGPAFLPWQWMDNMDGHAGPLSDAWIDDHAELGGVIVERERAWGMTPILPGFGGHVPAEFAEKHPDARYLSVAWGGFKPIHVLNPADPLFVEVGKVYMQELISLFGATGFYAIDLFHESKPCSDDPQFLQGLGRDISNLLAQADPNATWVMQAWSENEHIIRGIPKDRLLMLDIGRRRLEATDGLYGVNAVWGTIHSFGGQTEIGGNLQAIPDQLERSRKYPNCVGAGAFPESIYNNPVLFELVFESAVSEDKIDLERWIPAYVRRRYGCENAHAQNAWRMLVEHVYTQGRGDPLLAARPRLNPVRANAWGDFRRELDRQARARFFPIWKELLLAASMCGGADGYRFDVVDVGRQALSSLGLVFFDACRDAFAARDPHAFDAAVRQFAQWGEDLDLLLGSRAEFRLDDHIQEARRWGKDREEADLFEYNVRMQITLWGAEENPHTLFDYCCREWQGLIGSYYMPRWSMFFDYLREHLETGRNFDESALPLSKERPALEANDFYKRLFAFERRWTHATETTAPARTEDEIEGSLRLCEAYGKYSERETDGVRHEDMDRLFVENLGKE